MKAIISIAALKFLLISCEGPSEPTIQNLIIGSWQLKVVSGGFDGITDTLNPKVNNVIYVFNTQSEINIFTNQENTFSEKYYLYKNKDNSVWEMKLDKYKKSDGDVPNYFSILKINSKELSFADQGYDMYSYKLEHLSF
ncbi:MAG: hypothetical protein CR986_00050 [Ignavibacteriae bacterium]|nr:MAG: hypothetical protein CR986_00050 [Ignavibacteriota bacterium]